MKFFSSRFITLFAASTLTASTFASGCGGSKEEVADDDNGTGGEGGQSGGDGDSGPAPDSFCQSDKDCQENDQVCDLTRSVCVDCTEDADCGDEAICFTATCTEITACNSSKDCPSGQVCSDTLNYCVECEGNVDCEDTEICHETKCELSCDSDKDCQNSGEVCNTELGVCLECVKHPDCAENQFCSASGLCLDDICEQGDAICSGGNLSTCGVVGGGFDTTVCADGCASGNMNCATGGDCTAGDEGCECYGNGTCNDDLSCLSDLCVDPLGGTGGSNGTGGGNGSGGTGAGVTFCEKPEAIADFENESVAFCAGSYNEDPDSIGTWSLSASRGTALPAARGDSEYGMHLTTTSNSGIYAADFSATYDASSYDGFGFWAIGAGQVLGVGVHTTATYADSFKGFILNGDNMNTGITLTSEWVFYEVMFSNLTTSGSTPSLNAATMEEIQFLVGAGQDFWVDDIVFVKK